MNSGSIRRSLPGSLPANVLPIAHTIITDKICRLWRFPDFSTYWFQLAVILGLVNHIPRFRSKTGAPPFFSIYFKFLNFSPWCRGNRPLSWYYLNVFSLSLYYRRQGLSSFFEEVLRWPELLEFFKMVRIVISVAAFRNTNICIGKMDRHGNIFCRCSEFRWCVAYWIFILEGIY